MQIEDRSDTTQHLKNAAGSPIPDRLNLRDPISHDREKVPFLGHGYFQFQEGEIEYRGHLEIRAERNQSDIVVLCFSGPQKGILTAFYAARKLFDSPPLDRSVTAQRQRTESISALGSVEHMTGGNGQSRSNEKPSSADFLHIIAAAKYLKNGSVEPLGDRRKQAVVSAGLQRPRP